MAEDEIHAEVLASLPKAEYTAIVADAVDRFCGLDGRLEAYKAGEATERAKIVAWLRVVQRSCDPVRGRWFGYADAGAFADMIEAGAHLE